MHFFKSSSLVESFYIHSIGRLVSKSKHTAVCVLRYPYAKKSYIFFILKITRLHMFGKYRFQWSECMTCIQNFVPRQTGIESACDIFSCKELCFYRRRMKYIFKGRLSLSLYIVFFQWLLLCLLLIQIDVWIYERIWCRWIHWRREMSSMCSGHGIQSEVQRQNVGFDFHKPHKITR